MTYLKAFEADADKASEYLYKSVGEKTQQQIRLEEILGSRFEPREIADICCGAGGLSFHLSKFYPRASFALVDLGDHAISLARKVASSFSGNVFQADCCQLPLPSSWFDLVFCWQSLSWIDNHKKAIDELVRICKPGGSVFASALFNTEYDVDLDIFAKDAERSEPLRYRVISAKTIAEWITCKHVFHDFQMPIDIPKSGRGLGTHTLGIERLQISGGLLMNWKILEIKKGLAVENGLV